MPAADTAADQAITTRGDVRCSSAAAQMIADGPGPGGHREQHARENRYRVDRCAQLRDEQRQHGSEAAIDELQAEDDDHQQDEVLEREHVPERDAVVALRIVIAMDAAARRTSTNTSTSATT